MGQTFDSSSVKSWGSDTLMEVPDVLNVDAIDKYMEDLLAQVFPAGFDDSDPVVIWIRSVLRKEVTGSELYLIVTPLQRRLASGQNNVFVVDPRTLPKFALDKILMGIPMHWWYPPSKLKTKRLLSIARMARFRLRLSGGQLRYPVSRVASLIEARNRRASVLWMLRETSKDTAPVSSEALTAAGLRAVELKTRHSAIREGFLMRNCIHDYASSIEEGEVRMWSIRSVAKRPVATLAARVSSVNGTDEYEFMQCTGFANNKANGLPEATARAFALELGIKSLPHIINADGQRGINSHWQHFDDASKDFLYQRRDRNLSIDSLERPLGLGGMTMSEMFVVGGGSITFDDYQSMIVSRLERVLPVWEIPTESRVDRVLTIFPETPRISSHLSGVQSVSRLFRGNRGDIPRRERNPHVHPTPPQIVDESTENPNVSEGGESPQEEGAAVDPADPPSSRELVTLPTANRRVAAYIADPHLSVTFQPRHNMSGPFRNFIERWIELVQRHFHQGD